ncbi:MAG: hypothetical protein P8J27_01045 [Mariniblastus sp.]|nr:hypothetical protein [Mariniblastus sp.]
MLEQSTPLPPAILMTGPLTPSVVIGPLTRFSNRASRKLSIRKSFFIRERSAWSNMTLTIISGTCRVEIAGQSKLINAGEFLEIPPHVAHRLVAMTDVRAIVTFDALACTESEKQKSAPFQIATKQ